MKSILTGRTAEATLRTYILTDEQKAAIRRKLSEVLPILNELHQGLVETGYFINWNKPRVPATFTEAQVQEYQEWSAERYKLTEQLDLSAKAEGLLQHKLETKAIHARGGTRIPAYGTAAYRRWQQLKEYTAEADANRF